MDISFKKELNTLDTVERYEYLRLDSYGQVQIPENIRSNYRQRIYDCEYMVIGLYLDDILAAGIYVSDFADSIFVDHLFVKKEYQECGLKLGRLLLQYVLNNKEMFYEFFRSNPDESKLFANSEKSKRIYEKIGYKSVDGSCMYVKKLVKDN